MNFANAKEQSSKNGLSSFIQHGNKKAWTRVWDKKDQVLRITKAGDPGETYMRNNYAALQRTFAAQGFDVHLAFQNHGGKGTTFPQSLFPWSSPPDTDVVPQLANASCSHVLITGTISFVVDNSETLFDEAIDDRRMLNGKPAEVTPVFNADPTFAAYLGGVLARALNGTGPALRDLKQQ